MVGYFESRISALPTFESLDNDDVVACFDDQGAMGRVQRLQRIGSASHFGQVFLARIVDSGATFVSKTYHLNRAQWSKRDFAMQFDQMPEAVREQLLEIEVMSFLKPYIVQYRIPHFPLLYGFGVCQTSDGDVLHLFMEQLDGDLKSMRGKLTEDQVKSVLLQVLVALYLFHQFGLVHEDMHAGNVMFHRVPEDTCIEYTLPGGRIVVPTYGLFCYIIDYGKVRDVSSASTLDQQDGMQYDVTQFLDKLLRDVARTVAITVTADDGLLVPLATYAEDALFALDTPSFHVPYILDIHAKLFPRTRKTDETLSFDLQVPHGDFPRVFLAHNRTKSKNFMDYLRPPAPPSQPARGRFAKAPVKRRPGTDPEDALPRKRLFGPSPSQVRDQKPAKP